MVSLLNNVSLVILFLCSYSFAIEHKINVLLHSIPKDHIKAWDITTPTGCTITGVRTKKIPHSTLNITLNNGKWYINNVPLMTDSFKIRASSFQIENKTYTGALFCAIKNDKAYLINQVDLEEYVASVLRTESWPGWPIEVNKVFAVVCRTYGLAMKARAKKLSRLWDIRNTNAHQTYAGSHSVSVIHDAVAQTKGLILTHNNNPIIAMFDSCCGGVIPAHIAGVNFDQTPYLKRTYACLACSTCNIYRWKASLSQHYLQERLQQYLSLKDISHVRVSSLDTAGLVKTVKITSSDGEYTLSGKQFYSAFPEVKSYFFRMHYHPDGITIAGKGYGHHLGLCQWGARELVRNGWSHKKILAFYYPFTKLSRI